MDDLSRENFRLMLAAFIEREGLDTKSVARAIGCPEASIHRILDNSSLPSGEMMKQGALLFALGFDTYRRLTAAERENFSEALGAVGGGVLGFASISAAISSLGFAGVSAAGITSGLAALGALVGGGMVAGVAVAAAIPLAAGAAGYAVIKAVKHFVNEAVLKSPDLNERWEIPLPPDDGSDEPDDNAPL